MLDRAASVALPTEELQRLALSKFRRGALLAKPVGTVVEEE